MTLFKLKSSSIVLIEDDYNKNLLPLITELTQDVNTINIFRHEYPAWLWLKVFNGKNVIIHDDVNLDDINTVVKSTVIIDSINQMALRIGWDKCLRKLIKLSLRPIISKMIIILHKDCLLPGSNIQTHLNHISDAIVSYDTIDPFKIKVQIKAGGKVYKSEELLSYDFSTSILNLTPFIKPNIKEDPTETIKPGDISTFKIEVDQLNQLAKHQIKLPYMSKINEGRGKVYYEPDAIDDWDDEDPDDDLDV